MIDDEHDWLHEGIKAATLRAVANEASFEELRRTLDELSRRASDSLDSRDLVDARRTIARGMARVAQIMKQPLDVCLPLFQAVLDLGFDDTDYRYNQVGAFARYCLNAGHPEVMLQSFTEALTLARAEFEASSLEGGEALLRDMIKYSGSPGT